MINEKGEIHAAKLTKGSIDDRVPVPGMVKHLTGLLFGDKGYVKSQLFQDLYSKNLKLVTGIKKNMKNLPINASFELENHLYSRKEKGYRLLHLIKIIAITYDNGFYRDFLSCR